MNRGVYLENVNNFSIYGINITNLTYDYSKGIHVHLVSNGVIHDNYISSAIWGGVHFRGNYTNITNNHFIGNEQGINFQIHDDTNNNLVINNSFINNSYGFDCSGDWGSHGFKNVISYNVFQNNSYYALYLDKGNDTLVNYNEINESSIGIYFGSDAYSNVVHNNNISNLLEDSSKGIYLYSGDEIAFYNNRLENISGKGIYAEEFTNANISFNYINNCSDYGFYGIATNDSVFIENEFTGNPGTVFYIKDSNNMTFNENTLNNNPSNYVFYGYNLKNSSIEGNSIGYNSGRAIKLDTNSENILFYDNQVYGNYGGNAVLEMDSLRPNNITFFENNFSDNAGGVEFFGINNNFSNNNITNSYEGLVLYVSSSNITIRNNNLINNSEYDFRINIMDARPTILETLDLSGNLLTDNKKIYFNDSISDEVFNLDLNSDLGFLILKNSSNITVENFILESPVILFEVNSSSFTNLSISNTDRGFWSYSSDSNNFSNNQIKNLSSSSFSFYSSSNDYIFRNNIWNVSGYGFNSEDGINSTVSENNFSLKGEGISVSIDNSTLYKNLLLSDYEEAYGLDISGGYNNISENSFVLSGEGAAALYSEDTLENNTFYNNLFEANNSINSYSMSLDFTAASGNLFYENTFKAKEIAFVEEEEGGDIRPDSIGILEGDDEDSPNKFNQWNNSGRGNYWLYLNETSRDCTDSDDNGICDNTYSIAGNNTDYYPLVYGWDGPTDDDDDDDDDSSSSSGGGGGASNGAALTKAGISKTYRIGSKYQFSYGDSAHSVTISGVVDGKANITIASTPTSYLLGVGETAQKDLDDDGDYDMLIEVTAVTETSAAFTIKAIEEKSTDEVVVDSALGTDINNNESVEEKGLLAVLDNDNGSRWWIWIIFGLAVVGLVAMIFLKPLSKKK